MEKDLCKFYDNITILNKDLAEYKDNNGNMFILNTVNLLLRVDHLELTKEEYQVAKFQQKVEDLDYTITNIKKAVPKNEITGKDEDKYTITEKELAVRNIYNVSNAFGIVKSFTNKEDALKLVENKNKEILKYLI